ncbi:MAG: phage tail tape measure protein [Alloprevotella sp.]
MTDRDIKTIELIINNEQAKKRLEELKVKFEDLKVKREKALNDGDAKGLAIYTKEMKKVEGEMQRIETRAKVMGQALKNLDKSAPKELQRTIRELQRELNSGKVQRGSAEWQSLTLAIRETKQELANVNREIKAVNDLPLGDRLAKWSTKWVALVMNIQTFITGYSGLRQLMQSAVSEYAGMEEAKAQVRKYTGLSAEAIDDLNENLKKMDTRTSREQLNALAGDAGKLGITSKKQILDFVEAADKINVALGDDLGDGAVKNVGKLAMLFEEDKRLGLKGAMLATASVINELSQNSSAGAGYLEEFTARVAGVGKQAGLTQAQIMGFAAVLDENMQQDETSATAFSQLITKMYQEPAKFAALAGKDVKEFSRLLKEDANGALIAFLGNMKAQGGFDKLAPMFEKMGLDGTRATSVLSSVADKLGNVEKMQRLANEAYSEAVSINNEFTVQNTTVQAQLDKAKKDLVDLREKLGEQLLPVAAKMVNLNKVFMETLSALITWFGKHGKQVIAVTTVIAVYNLTLKATVAWEALHNMQLKAKIANLISVAKSMSLYKTVTQVCAVAQGLFTVAVTLFTKGLTAARLQFSLLTAAMLKNPIGLVAVALSALAGIVLKMTGYFDSETEEIKENTKALQGREKALKDCKDAEQDAAKSVETERMRIDALRKIIQDANRPLKERLAAIKELKEIAPGYNASITKEGEAIEENTQKIDDYLEKLKKKALVEALYDRLKESMQKKYDADSAKKAWDNAVNIGERRLRQPEYQSQKEEEWGYSWGGGLRKYEVEKNEKYTWALQRSYHNLQKQGFWAKKQKEAQDEIDSIFEYAKEQNADKEFENRIAKGEGSGTTPGKGRTVNLEDEKKKRKEAKERKEKIDKYIAEMEQAGRDAAIAYAKGEHEGSEDYYRLLDLRLAAAEKFKNNSLKIAGLTEEEKNDVLKKYEQERNSILNDYRQQKLKDEDARYSEEKRKLNAQLSAGNITTQQYNEQAADALKKHYDTRLSIVEKYCTDEKQLLDERRSQEENISREIEGKIKKLFTLIEQAKDTAIGDDPAKKLQKELQQINRDEQDAIKLFEEFNEQLGLAPETLELIKKHFEELRKKAKLKAEVEVEVETKWGKSSSVGANTDLGFTSVTHAVDGLKSIKEQREQLEKDNKKSLERDGENLKDYAKKAKKLESDKWAAIRDIAIQSLQAISNMMQQVSSLMQANCSLETAKVEQEYDARIAAAEGNEELQKQLEQEKQQRISQIKAEYAEKEFKMNIAMAIANTAANAIAAYGAMAKISIIGPALGAAAAAAATAAGMIQVAVIKKQYEAQKAAGFYVGGFTGGRNYRRPAGIVHEGEYVLPHQAIENPAISPFLNLIENARRNNRLASLTPEDVSRTVTAPQAAAMAAKLTAKSAASTAANTGKTATNTASPVVTIKGGDQTADTLRRLNEKLDEGLQSYVVIDGPQGLDKQWNRYKKLNG